jgi:ParB family transcriptional regulator, chromosome partitioning protein
MATRRGGLGRGLEALIPSGTDGQEFRRIRIDEIVPNPNQPRTTFDEAGLEELAASIGEVGILQPVVVRPLEDGRFALIAGERRWRAARRAGLGEVPAVVRTSDDRGTLTEALIENLQRTDLTPMEEAAAFHQLLEDHGMTHEQVAVAVGKSRPAISNTLRLLQLPASIQGLVERGQLSAGHARALVTMDDTAYAEHIARRAVEEGWSVRQVEEAVKARVTTGERPAARATITEVRPVEIIELEQRLRDRLDSRVEIKYGNRKGLVEIHFGSLEELERLYRRFFD